MTAETRPVQAEQKASWAPMVALALAQVLMSFNVAALPVSLGGMVESFGVPPTTVRTGIVMYGLVVAALVMTGAKLGQKYGWVLVFRVVIVVFGIAMVLMVIAPDVWFMITAQGLAGASAAIIVPALVALIAENYRGAQQATAVGSLGSARGVRHQRVPDRWHPGHLRRLASDLDPARGAHRGRLPAGHLVRADQFNLAVFVSAMVVVHFYGRFTSRGIARTSFGLTTIALVWLSIVVTNNWETVPTIIGLIVFGVGQGALVTLLFNVLVTASPKSLAGDVGSLRGTTQNLASAVGTALAGAMLVTLLGTGVGNSLSNASDLPQSLQQEVGLDSVNFVANDHLRDVLSKTSATPSQVEEAVQVNTDARLGALKLGLLILAGASALAIIPVQRLPKYRAGEIPAPDLAAGPEPDVV